MSRGTRLTSINCFPYASWAGPPRPLDPPLSIVSGVLKGFLSSHSSTSGGSFAWEDLFSLKSISVGLPTWEIASQLGKPRKGMKEPVWISDSICEEQRVGCRDITATLYQCMRSEESRQFEWIDAVATGI